MFLQDWHWRKKFLQVKNQIIGWIWPRPSTPLNWLKMSKLLWEFWSFLFLCLFFGPFLTNKVPDGLFKPQEWMDRLEVTSSNLIKCNFSILLLSSFWFHCLIKLFIHFLLKSTFWTNLCKEWWLVVFWLVVHTSFLGSWNCS